MRKGASGREGRRRGCDDAKSLDLSGGRCSRGGRGKSGGRAAGSEGAVTGPAGCSTPTARGVGGRRLPLHGEPGGGAARRGAVPVPQRGTGAAPARRGDAGCCGTRLSRGSAGGRSGERAPGLRPRGGTLRRGTGKYGP